MGILKKIKMLEKIVKQQFEFNKQVLLHNDKADELQKIKFSSMEKETKTIKEKIESMEKEIESIKKTLLINSISIGIVTIVLIICVVVNV